MPGGSNYMAVPNPSGEADLGADRPTSYMSEGSILQNDQHFLGRHEGPAPSIMSRDSTYSSLAPPSLNDNLARSSWGSNKNFGDAGALPAGAEARPRVPSTLAMGYTSPFPDDPEEQGHIQPNAPVPHSDKELPAWAGGSPPKKRKSRAVLWALIIALVLICLGVGLGVGLGIAKPWENKSASSSNDKSNADANKDHPNNDHKSDSPTPTDPAASASASPSATAKPTWGGQGSTILLSDGTNMTYENPFGGYWVWDEANPLNNSAKCNSWTPALDEEWNFDTTQIRGVNLGGWLNTEPFIAPYLYEQTPTGPAGTSIDEYTLSVNLGDRLEEVMTNHYETFITERDFAEIASAGLNYIRLPIPHWAVQKWEGEPYLEGVAWNYVLKALQWARKYGLRVNLDLHTVPGSQNGWNHSGKLGLTNFLNGSLGLANAQRSLDIMRSIAQFISQPQWSPVVTMFGFINEPQGATIGQDAIGSFNLEVYNMVREITGNGKGKGPIISMHNAFLGNPPWFNFLRGADRLALDIHPYLVFNDQMGPNPETFKYRPCTQWAVDSNQTSMQFGINSAGEFSAAVNDCGLFLNGVGLGTRFEGTYNGWEGKRMGSCEMWDDWTSWDQPLKDTIATYAAGSMDALQNYFFWTWKIGNSTGKNPEPNPLWHYRLGLREGWLPKDPRSVIGTCVREAGVVANDFYTMAQPWMTGGPGAGENVQTASYRWPPTAIGTGGDVINDMGRLYQYTQTANPVTLPGPTHTAPGAQKAFDFGNGWANANDNRRAYTAIAGCQYPDEYTAAASPVPGNACGAGLVQPSRRSLVERNPAPTPTPAA